MQRVLLKGWKPGLRKVALTTLLQRRAGLSLGTAKALMDRCLAGEEVTVELPTLADAEAFARQASALGAVVELDLVRQQR